MQTVGSDEEKNDDKDQETGWRERLLAVGQALDLFPFFQHMLLLLTLAAHTQTHIQTGPQGVFSPEVAICNCLFGMQWALPPISVKPIPS